MKPFLLAVFLSVMALPLAAQDIPDTLENVTPDRPALIRKLVALPCGIQEADSKPVILDKLKRFLDNYRPAPTYAEDRYAKAAVEQALKSVREGGYGIGAVLVDSKGEILHKAHNAQLQKGRSDLHAEMNLLNEFEDLPRFQKYKAKAGFTGEGNTIYTEQLVLYTSAEPCPMCFVRVSIVGVDTRYVTTGPDDGMNARAACLPKFWYDLSQKHKVTASKSAPVLGKIAHVLFFSFLL